MIGMKAGIDFLVTNSTGFSTFVATLRSTIFHCSTRIFSYKVYYLFQHPKTMAVL